MTGAHDMHDLYDAVLESVLRGVPYNSATEYLHWYNGSEPDPRHGVACIYQTLYVAERARELGAPEARILQDMRHIGAVFETGGDIVVLDPYLLHLTPIRFPAQEVQSGHSAVEVDAAPFRLDAEGGVHPARLAAVYRSSGDGYRIRLSYSKYSVKSGSYFLSRHFTLRSENVFVYDDFSADMPGLLTHPEQNSVSIRALVQGEAVTAEAIIPLNDFASRDFSPADIWLRSGQGTASRTDADARSDAVWADLQRTTGLKRAAIEEHLVEAARVYQRIADPQTILPHYNLQDA